MTRNSNMKTFCFPQFRNLSATLLFSSERKSQTGRFRITTLWNIVLLGLMCASSGRAQVYTWGYWRMGENTYGAGVGYAVTGAITDDLANHPLIPQGTLRYTNDLAVEAKIHTGTLLAVDFSSGSYLSNNFAYFANYDNFGIEAWVKTRTTSQNHIVVCNGNGVTDGWAIRQSGATWQCEFAGKATFGAAPVVANAWTHLALVREGGTATLYVNGVAAGASTVAPTPVASGFAIGAYPGGGSAFIGVIDEVRLFDFLPGRFQLSYLLWNAPSQLAVLGSSAFSRDDFDGLFGFRSSVSSPFLNTTVHFEYGPTPSYGYATSKTDLAAYPGYQSAWVPISGLPACSDYHFRVVAENSAGITLGPDQAFRTTLKPVASTLNTTVISSNSAKIAGQFRPNSPTATAWFEWGTDITYGTATPTFAVGENAAGPDFVPDVYGAAAVTALATGQLYHYRAAISNCTGVAYGADRTFYVGDTIPPGVLKDEWLPTYDSNQPATTEWANATNWSLGMKPYNTINNQFQVALEGTPLAPKSALLSDYTVIDRLRLLQSEFAVSDSYLIVAQGVIENSGLLRIGVPYPASLVSTGEFRLQNPVPLPGKGRLTLAPSSTLLVSGLGPLINDLDHTIQGTGLIQCNELTNHGWIIADENAFSELGLNVARIRNDGTIMAQNSGFLRFGAAPSASASRVRLYNQDGIIAASTNSLNSPGLRFHEGATIGGGRILAFGNGWVQLDNTDLYKVGATFRGCTFSNEPTAKIEVRNAATFEDCAFRSPLQWGNAEPVLRINVRGKFENHATQVFPGAGFNTFMLKGDTVFSGSGVVQLSDGDLVQGFSVLTNDVGHTIAGAGQIGENQNADTLLVNLGTIKANDPLHQATPIWTGQLLPLHGLTETFNSGELLATDGGKLLIQQAYTRTLRHEGTIRSQGGLNAQPSEVVVAGRVAGTGQWLAEDGARIMLTTNAIIDLGGDIRARRVLNNREALIKVQGEVNGTGRWIAEAGGRIQLDENAFVSTAGDMIAEAGGVLELHNQNLFAPIYCEPGGRLETHEVNMLGSSLHNRGVVTVAPGGAFVTDDVTGDGKFFDPAQSSSASENQVFVGGRLNPGIDEGFSSTLSFDRLGMGMWSVLELDLYGPNPAHQDQIRVRNHFTSDPSTQLKLHFSYQPASNDVIQIVQAEAPNTCIISNWTEVQFVNVRRLTSQRGVYQDDEFIGDVLFATNGITVTNVRRPATLPLQVVSSGGNGFTQNVQAATSVGQRLQWLRSHTLEPGSWGPFGAPFTAAAGTTWLSFDTREAAQSFFRLVELGNNCPALPGSLVHWWRAQSLVDSAGTASAVLFGGAALGPGRTGTAFMFDGVDDRLRFSGAALPPGGVVGGWTVSMWVCRTNSPDQSSALFLDSQYALKLEQYGNAGRYVGITKFGVLAGDKSFNYSVPEGEWTHLAFADSPGGTQLYVNGTRQGTIPDRIPGSVLIRNGV